MERQTVVEQKCINSCWKGSSRKGPSIANTFIWRQWQCLTLVLALALNNTNEYFETVGFLAPSQCGALQCLKKKERRMQQMFPRFLTREVNPLTTYTFSFWGNQCKFFSLKSFHSLCTRDFHFFCDRQPALFLFVSN